MNYLFGPYGNKRQIIYLHYIIEHIILQSTNNILESITHYEKSQILQGFSSCLLISVDIENIKYLLIRIYLSILIATKSIYLF